MEIILLIMGLAWLFGSAEDANKKKKSHKRRSNGPSHSARMHKMETGLHRYDWWD